MKYLTLDPGETTGYAVWEDQKLLVADQSPLWEFIESLAAALGVEGPHSHTPDEEVMHRCRGVQHVIYEDWSLYPWKLQELAWDKCRTARGIGAIEFICDAAGIPYTAQDAQIKDAAEAAGADELFLKPLHPNRHANDAVRHGVYFQLEGLAAIGEGAAAA